MTGISHRAMSLLLVLLLHVLLVLAFLRLMVMSPAVATHPERLLEMMIDTSRRLTPAPVMPRQKIAPPRAQPRGAPFHPLPSFVPPTEVPDIRGLGQAILGCAPENLSNLTPDQRVHCPNTFTRPDDSAVLEPRSRVKDPNRRAAEMAAKNTPGRIPCTYIAVDAAQRQAAPAVDWICLADGLFGRGFAPLTGLPK
jgi:hypothetical protein